LPEFSGFSFYFFLLLRRVPKRCIFYEKCGFIDIWLACPELKQKLSISDYNVILLFFCADNTLLLKLLFVPCVLNLLQIKYIFLRVS